MKKLLFALLFALSFISCETEFSLNGDYTITPVVFGLLDQTQNAHMIKITKAYLGDGDNLVYAQNPDSNYFASVDARVVEYLYGDATGREWQLKDSIISTKDTSGIFYAPEQKVYVFYANDLDPLAEYELVADLNEGEHSIKARTSLIDGFRLQTTLANPGYRVNFNGSDPAANGYGSWKFTTYEGTNAKEYNYKYTFRWREFYTDGTSQVFEITRNNGNKTQEKASSPSVQNVNFNGEDFFLWLQDKILVDENVEKRNMLSLDLQVAVAHEDLAKYMEVAQPVSGIAQVTPEYTNIEGGLGLFSSRIIHVQPNFRFDTNTMKELCTGQYTYSLKFCSQYADHISYTWYCD